METPGQGRRPDQYEFSVRIMFYSVLAITILFIIMFIGSALNLI
jgi:hypothetical protein